MSMNIYLVTRDKPGGWDTYVSFVCYAHTPGEAQRIHPRTSKLYPSNGPVEERVDWDDSMEWCHPSFTKAEYIGLANGTIKPQVIHTYYHHG